MAMQEKRIDQPIESYRDYYKDKHAQNTSEMFESLVKASGVNEAANTQTVKEIKQKENKINLADKHVGKFKGIRILLIVLIVVSVILAIIFAQGAFGELNLFGIDNQVVNIILMIVSALLNIVWVYLIFGKINKIIKTGLEKLSKLKSEHQELMQVAWTQMEVLNGYYDWGVTAQLIQKTAPIIKLDPYFDMKRFDFMRNKYGLYDGADQKKSIQVVQSGEIEGNPFLIVRDLAHEMGEKVYTGSITISWTEVVHTKNGTRTVTRTQVLTASVSKPFPDYYNTNYLVYSNEASPNLIFSREPGHVEKLNEKQTERHIKQKVKDFESLLREQTVKGGTFNLMNNEAFEALFNATDRNDELEFRMLFDPLAQQEMIKILKDKTVGFGDDFIFYKEKYLNYIAPEHLKGIDLETDPSRYVTYDLAQARKIFNDFNNAYFKSFYFTLAPVLSIPLYQSHKPRAYIYRDTYNQEVSPWEHEAMANYLDIEKLRHPDSVTNNILKTKMVNHLDGMDNIEVTAHGYRGEPRVDIATRLGGDGRMHTIPIHWTEYLPVQKATQVSVKTAENINRHTFMNNMNSSNQNDKWRNYFSQHAHDLDHVIFRRGILAFMPNKPFTKADNEALNEWINKKDVKND